MTATLRVTARAWQKQYRDRGKVPAPGDLWPEQGESWDVLAGALVELTGKTAGDESEIILRDGTPAWIESRYL